MQFTLVITLVFIAICFPDTIYADRKPTETMKRRHLETESEGILELDLDGSVVRQIYDDKLLTHSKENEEDNNMENGANALQTVVVQDLVRQHLNNPGNMLRLAAFGKQTDTNSQVSNQLNKQINFHQDNHVASSATNQVPITQNGMTVVSVAIPQVALQQSINNAIANQLLTANVVQSNNVNNENFQENAVPENQTIQNMSNGSTAAFVQKSQVHTKSHDDEQRIRFSVPNSMPLVIQLKDKMIVNRKVKRVHKRKQGRNENIRITW